MREGQPHRGKLRARAGSKSVESTSARRKPSSFAGLRWKRTLAGLQEEGRSLQPPRLCESATRVLGGLQRGGALAVRSKPFARVPPAHVAHGESRSAARLVTAIG